MRKVVTHFLIPYNKDFVWKYLADVKSYPNYVTFVKKTEVPGKMKKGTEWYDTTAILWYPMRLYHINTSWEEKRRISFRVELPVRGTMRQDYVLEKIEDKTKLTGTVYFEFKNVLLDAVLGAFLAKRLRYMLVSSFKRIEKNLMLEKQK